MKVSHYSIISLLFIAFFSYSFIPMVNVDTEPITITGTVLDAQHVPLIGASVVEVGTTNGTITNFDGQFTLQVQHVNTTLVFAYTGFASQKVEINTATFKMPMVIYLSEGTVLNEIVVTSGAKARKRNKQASQKNTRSESKISSNDMNNVGISAGDVVQRPHHLPPPPPAAMEAIQYHEEDKELEEGNYSAITENEFFNSIKNPLSTLSIDVDRASYSNMRRFLQQGQLPPSDAIRVEEMVNYFNYNYKAPSLKADRPFNTETTLTTCPWNNEHRLLHVALQGAKLDRKDIPSSNFVFLIDVSGSMNNADKLPLLKSAFKLFINQLDEDDRVAMVVYAGAAGCVLESTPGSDKNKIMTALDNLHAGGSTAGAADIQQAYKIAEKNFINGGNNRIILATDGDFNVGTAGDDALVKLIEEKRKSGVFLSILGFGQGNYQDGKMQKIADAGNGNHSYIDNMQEAKKVLMDEFGGTMFTIAKDVKIQIEFNPATVESYRMVGYENRVLKAEDFNDDSKDAGEMGAGHTVTVLYEIIPVGANSSFSKKVDPLKYQFEKPSSANGSKQELATIKYRFKKPDAKTSTKSEETIQYRVTNIEETSTDIQWAAYVAEFGLLLRKSKYVIDGNYDQVILSANEIMKTSRDKYREEFVDLVEIAKALDTQFLTAEKEE